jgi:hypothetical protein
MEPWLFLPEDARVNSFEFNGWSKRSIWSHSRSERDDFELQLELAVTLMNATISPILSYNCLEWIRKHHGQFGHFNALIPAGSELYSWIKQKLTDFKTVTKWGHNQNNHLRIQSTSDWDSQLVLLMLFLPHDWNRWLLHWSTCVRTRMYFHYLPETERKQGSD